MTENNETVPTDSTSTESAESTVHYHSHVKTFLTVFACLCALTAASFAIANSSLMDTKVTAWILMMVISFAKAMLVIGYFMHLKWEANWKFTLTLPATVMSLLLCLILVPDILKRGDRYDRVRKIHAAEPVTQEAAKEKTTESH